MRSDPSLFTKRIRHLSQALIISGVLNIGVLSVFLYWALRERPPTPYCELKPASPDEQQMPLADQRGLAEVFNAFSRLSFSQLLSRLSHTQLIENGYAERDVALAYLVSLHYFDIQRALPNEAQPRQKRLMAWTPSGKAIPIPLVLYPGLSEEQFELLIQFAKTERWPLTAEGLFLLLQKKRADHQKLNGQEASLAEAFMLTPEFWTLELLFNRSGRPIDKGDILTLLLEGNWISLKSFVDQQRAAYDASDARRQKFLLDYLKGGAPSAAALLLKMEWDFSVKKLGDSQVIAIMQLMPVPFPESLHFAQEMLASPRGAQVWHQASQWLYARAGEPMPKPWNYQTALARFLPEKPPLEGVPQPALAAAAFPAPVPLVLPKISLSLPLKPPSIREAVSSIKERNASGKTSSGLVVTRAKKQPVPEKAPDVAIQARLYTVQEGDSLWKIARQFGVKIERLKMYNHLKSDALKPGMTIKIPES